MTERVTLECLRQLRGRELSPLTKEKKDWLVSIKTFVTFVNEVDLQFSGEERSIDAKIA